MHWPSDGINPADMKKFLDYGMNMGLGRKNKLLAYWLPQPSQLKSLFRIYRDEVFRYPI